MDDALAAWQWHGICLLFLENHGQFLGEPSDENYLSIFPKEIKEIIMSALKDSYGRCTVNQKFLDRFYDIFLTSHPAIKPMFAKTDFAK
ncbi:MAG: hypothetical protein M1392_00060 [Gammaproteobacteria bacterium]|nr:hypothetical protein [Gammaproteobacteria bacterium]